MRERERVHAFRRDLELMEEVIAAAEDAVKIHARVVDLEEAEEDWLAGAFS